MNNSEAELKTDSLAVNYWKYGLLRYEEFWALYYEASSTYPGYLSVIWRSDKCSHLGHTGLTLDEPRCCFIVSGPCLCIGCCFWLFKCVDAVLRWLTERFRSLSVPAKVWGWWKETGWPEAQRKRPEQQHQLHSSTFVIGHRELLKSPRAPFQTTFSITPSSVFIPQTAKETCLEQDTLLSLITPRLFTPGPMFLV